MASIVLPVSKVVPPSAIAGLYATGVSGKLPDSQLVQVGPSGYLQTQAARAFKALQFMCLGIRLPLTYTYGGCYRSYAQQVALFRSRYSVGGKYGDCKLWDSNNDGRTETWCKHLVDGRVPATAAVPGKSNHGWGLAVDAAFDLDFEQDQNLSPEDARSIMYHPQWPAFRELVPQFGFSWELQSEPWHIRYVTGDRIPQRVLDVEAFINSGEPPVQPDPYPVPVPSNWLEIKVDTLPNIGAFSVGGAVRIAQGLLAAHGVKPNGQWITDVCDGEMVNFIKFFQGMKGLITDGIIGPKTWQALLTV